MTSRHRTAIALAIGAAAVAAAGTLGCQVLRTRNYYWRPVDRALRYGFTERRITVRDGLTLQVAESPQSSRGKIPLLLIPGQGSIWQDYARVLPALAEQHHVIAVDVHGHGGSTWAPTDYNAVTIADDLHLLAEQCFGRPYAVSGHSSGGLIAARMAAAYPEDIRAVILEDAPFFSTAAERVPGTYVGQDYEILAAYLAEDPETREPDYVVYSLPHTFIGTFFGDGWSKITAQVIRQRRADPSATPNIAALGVTLNRIWESISHPYDLRWSASFFLSRYWHQGFDQAATLRQIQAPTLFLKAPTRHQGGILLAALDDDDLARVEDLVPDINTARIKSSHDIHFAKPKWFVRHVTGLTSQTR